MAGLRMKDRGWMVAMVLVGSVGLALAIASRGFFNVFVLSPPRLEVTFALAAIVGLLLGAVATLWDVMLGTREYLMHRPVSDAALARAPLVACGIVLLSWMVLVPLLTWLFAVIGSSEWAWSFLPGVPSILATLMIAWPACAVSCVAVSLPLPWWGRVLVAGALFVSLGCSIETLSTVGVFGGPWWNGEAGETSMWMFALVCLAVTAALALVAVRCRTVRTDADRPWGAPVRLFAGLTLVLAFGFTIARVGGEMQGKAILALENAYPLVGEYDGGVGLFVPAQDWRSAVACNADHQVVGETRPFAEFERIVCPGPGGPNGLLELDAPVWNCEGDAESVPATDCTLIVDHRGRVWLFSRDRRTLTRTGIGPELADMPESSNTHLGLWHQRDTGDGSQRLMAMDHVERSLWSFDLERGYFVPVALPNGDRAGGGFSWNAKRARERGLDAPRLVELLAEHDIVQGLRGDADYYVLKDGEFVALGLTPVEQERREPRVVYGDRDPLSYRVVIEARGDVAAFEHQFTPRTANERFHAYHALSWSVLRPPVFQLASFLLAGETTGDTAWHDPLLAGGRRPWLLGLGLAFAAYGAFGMWRRLRRFGAAGATMRFWTVASFCVGPVGVFLCLLCERGRAYRRPYLAAASAPRIVSRGTGTNGNNLTLAGGA